MKPEDIAIRHVREGVEFFIRYCRSLLSDELVETLREPPGHVSYKNYAPGNLKPLEHALLSAVLAHVSQTTWRLREANKEIYDMVHNARSRWLDERSRELLLRGSCLADLITDWERIAGYVLHRKPLEVGE